MEKKSMWLAPKTMRTVVVAAVATAALAAGSVAGAWATDYDTHTTDPYNSTYFKVGENMVESHGQAAVTTGKATQDIIAKINTSSKPVDLSTGWYKVDKAWYYYNAGSPAQEAGFYTGMHKIGDQTYFFNDDATLVTSKFVKLGTDSIVPNAEENQKFGAGWPDGSNSLDTQEFTITDLLYVNEDGYQQFGWTKIGDEWFHFANSDVTAGTVAGTLTEGWFKYDDQWYYLQPVEPDGNEDKGTKHGQMLANQGVSDGGSGSYWLDVNGVLANGWAQSGTDWSYFADGKKVESGWKMIDGSWYYFKNGVMQTGFVPVGEVGSQDAVKTSFFADWGGLQVGWFYLGEDIKEGGAVNRAKGWYHSDKDGVIDSTLGWKSIDGKWYFFTEDGHMFDKNVAYGTDKQGKTYEFSFDASGAWTGTKELGVMPSNISEELVIQKN